MTLYQSQKKAIQKEIEAVEQRLLDGSLRDWAEYRQLVGERKALIRIWTVMKAQFSKAEIEEADDDDRGNKA